jgi:acetoacetate decarboxylase
MGYVRTAEEIRQVESVLANPHFVDCAMLAVEARTTSAWLESVLPPPLVGSARPRVRFMIGRWRSNSVGPFNAGAVYLSCRHGETEGDYLLAMWVNSAHAMLLGRELYGEPKKLAVIEMAGSGSGVSAWVERSGQKIITLEFIPGQEIGPGVAAQTVFNFKAVPAASGIGLEGDVDLTEMVFTSNLTTRQRGQGRVTITGTRDDPLNDIEVVEILGADYAEGDVTATCDVVAHTAAAQFLSYFYGRMDDWSLDPLARVQPRIPGTHHHRCG